MAEEQCEKRRKSDCNSAKLKEEKHNKNSRCYNEKFISITAWVLFAIGLCVTVTTILLTVTHERSVPKGKLTYVERNIDLFLEVNTNQRLIDNDFVDKVNVNFSGCDERKCKIMCRNAQKIYSDLHGALSSSNCSVIDIMIIDKQQFPNGVLKNSWKSAQTTIRELTLTLSNVTRVKSEAFNSPMFSETFMLGWHKLKLEKVDGGALLGLKSLKYLTIETPISYLDRAFFQPVQTTLTHLKLHAGLNMARQSSLFGIVSNMTALEYIDFSYNNFNGALNQKMFLATPNLKHLIINRSRVMYIMENAFHHLVGKLRYLSLAHNFMISISSDAILPLLLGASRPLLNLSGNNWKCDCNLRGLIEAYKEHRLQFVDALFCKAPHDLYGTSLDEVYLPECSPAGGGFGSNLGGSFKAATTTTNVDFEFEETSLRAIEMVNKPTEKLFQLRCLGSSETDDMRSTSMKANVPLEEDGFHANTVRESKGNQQNERGSDLQASVDKEENYLNKYFEFEGPTHDFRLQLLENRSVEVIIQGLFCGSPTIVWFSDQMESLSVVGGNGILETSMDYECFKHNGAVCPSLIIDNLVEHTTYTFCLIPSGENAMTPLNCLPLYVPRNMKKTEDVWISVEDKQFTIGIISLIFLVSVFFGAVIAYFGIKTYPDLLEGSKNVLIVKKSNQTCYVSTISEEEYHKNPSFKEKLLGLSFKKNSGTTYLPETATPMPTIHAESLNISVKHLDRVCSLKSTSTCFEDPFVHIPYDYDSEYETPKDYERGFDYGYAGRSIPNNYGMSPGSPPPLPKRNSNSIYDIKE